MKLKSFVLLACSVILVGCGAFSSKFASDKVGIGMSKSDFITLFGTPYAKEMITDNNGRAVERLLYQERLYDNEWYILTTAFTFHNDKLVGQEIVGKRYPESDNHGHHHPHPNNGQMRVEVHK